MTIRFLANFSPLIACLLAMVVILPTQAAIEATEASGSTGMDTYFIENTAGVSYRAINNMGGWSNNGGYRYVETSRSANSLDLTGANGDIARFDFQTGDIFVVNSSSPPRKVGEMKLAHQLSPEIVNAFSYVSLNDGVWRETVWDQIYLQKDEGLSSGWTREVSVSAINIASRRSSDSLRVTDTRGVSRLSGYCSLACNFQQLAGTKIWRVELGDIFFKLFSTGGEELLSSSSYFDEAKTTSVLFKEEARNSTTITLVHKTGFKVVLDLKQQEILAAKQGQRLKMAVYMSPDPFYGWSSFALEDSLTADATLRSLLGNSPVPGALLDLEISSDGDSAFNFTFPEDKQISIGTFDVATQELGKAGTIKANGTTTDLYMLHGAEVGGRSVTGYSLGALGWDARESNLAEGIGRWARAQREPFTPRYEMAYIQLEGGYGWTMVEPDSRHEFESALQMIHKSRTRLLGMQEQIQLVVNLKSSRLESLNNEGAQLLTDRARVPHARLTWLKNYYPSQYEKDVPSLNRGESPGFQVQNRTDWPVYVQLAQGSTCYNRAILQPGEAVNWDTGAVWFAIEATMNQTTMPTDIECATQAIVIAGATVLGGVIAASTAGAGSGASAGLMAMVVGGSFSAVGEYATSAMNAAEWTDDDKLGFSIGLFVLEGVASIGMGAASAAKEALAEGAVTGLSVLARQAATTAGKTAMKKAVMEELAEGMVGFILDSHIEVGLNLLENGTEFGDDGLTVNEATEAEKDALLAEIDLNQFASLNDQYAGKTWPFVGEDRIRPTYVITGGPLYQLSADGATEFIFEEIEEMKVQECDYNTKHEIYNCIGDSK